MIRYVIFCLLLIGGSSNAHQFLPTYPKFQTSFVEGVVYTKMELFNKRKEIEYYQLSVYDKDWNSLPFATQSKIVRIDYLQTKEIEIYIKQEDLKNIMYICSESKVKKESEQNTVISSRICSKIR
jgi:hypothetical protein